MTVLARDAAEILFEMAAMQDKSPEAHDMLEKSQQIEVTCIASLQKTLHASLWLQHCTRTAISLSSRQSDCAEHAGQPLQ